MKLDIKSNFSAVQRRLDGLREDIRARVLASSLNKTMEQAKTAMGREIVAEYKVTSAYVRERLSIRRASFRAGVFNVEATLVGGNNKNRSANLIRFIEGSTTLAQARKRAKAGTLDQLHFQIKRAGGKKTVRGAFIGNKGRTVFVRTGNARLPIKALSTIDVPSMFNQKRINARVVAMIKAKVPEIFERDAKYFTEKFNARAA